MQRCHSAAAARRKLGRKPPVKRLVRLRLPGYTLCHGSRGSSVGALVRNRARFLNSGVFLAAALALGALGGCSSESRSDLFKLRLGGGGGNATATGEQPRETIWDLFTNQQDPNTTVEVNRYIWNAALDVLSFLPIEAVDPFSGVIVTGYGTPPGGGRPYRAIVYVRDPALDARSLQVSLMTRSGPVSPETVRAVEDAILTRARQLRVADSKL